MLERVRPNTCTPPWGRPPIPVAGTVAKSVGYALDLVLVFASQDSKQDFARRTHERIGSGPTNNLKDRQHRETCGDAHRRETDHTNERQRDQSEPNPKPF